MKLTKTLFIALLGLSFYSQAKTYSARTSDLEAAKKGDTSAMLRIAKQFDPDNDKESPVDNQEKDIEIAYEWYEKAAEKGDYTARKWMYRYYDEKEKPELALSWWKKQAAKAEKHDSFPMNWLGRYYFEQKDYEQAFYWLEEKGGMRKVGYTDIHARYLAKEFGSEMYRKGIGAPLDYQKALEIENDILEEDKSSLMSARVYLTQSILNKGQKMPPLKELIKQAENADNAFMRWLGLGDIEAMKLLGAIYLLGDYPEEQKNMRQDIQLKPNVEQARYWLEKYFQLNNNDKQVAYWLSLYDLEWMRKAAELSNPYALFIMAKAYYMGNSSMQKIKGILSKEKSFYRYSKYIFSIKDTEQAKIYAKLACEKGVYEGCKLYNEAEKFPEFK